MYIVKRFTIPEGYKLSEYASLLAQEIQAGNNVEENKDKLYRATYPVLFEYVLKFKNLASEENLVSDMALAFMRTVNNFDPSVPNASFINYYKLAAKTEIFNNEYRKYKRNEESRKLRYLFEGTIGSLEMPLVDKNGIDTTTLHETIADERLIIDDELMNEEFRKDLAIAVDRVFKKATEGPRSEKSRKLIEAYIQNELNDRPLMQKELVAKLGLRRQAMSNVMNRYLPLIKNELIKMGY
jgi:hypothetical protein